MNNKLVQWRNKTEKEKHTLAMVGSIILTSLVVLIWGYTFINTLGSEKEMAQTEEYSKQFSPLAPVKNLFSENVEKIKEGLSYVRGSATAVFTGNTPIEPDNKIQVQ